MSDSPNVSTPAPLSEERVKWLSENEPTLSALKNMGWKEDEDPRPYAEDLASMGPEERFDHWCRWTFGYAGWSSTILDAMRGFDEAFPGDGLLVRREAERRLESENAVLRDLLSMVFCIWLDYQKIKYEMYAMREPFAEFARKMPASEGAMLDAVVDVLGVGGFRGSNRPVIDWDAAAERINAFRKSLECHAAEETPPAPLTTVLDEEEPNHE